MNALYTYFISPRTPKTGIVGLLHCPIIKLPDSGIAFLHLFYLTLVVSVSSFVVSKGIMLWLNGR